MKKTFYLIMAVFVLFSSVNLTPVLAEEENSISLLSYLHEGFESQEEYDELDKLNVNTSSEWCSEGAFGSKGSMKVTTSGGNSGVAAFAPAGETYTISVCLKPLDDAALGNVECILYTDSSKVIVPDGADYGSPTSTFCWEGTTLSNVEALSGGWYRYSAECTIGDTCTGMYGDYAKQYNKSVYDCYAVINAGVSGIAFLMDDFSVEPSYETKDYSDGSKVVFSNNFENGTGGFKAEWTGSTELKTSGGAVDNKSCISFTGGDNGATALSLSGGIDIEPSRAYKISWYAKADNDATVGKNLAAYFDFSRAVDNENYFYKFTDLTYYCNPLTADWQYYEVVFKSKNEITPDIKSVSAWMYIRVREGGKGAEISFDEFNIEALGYINNGEFKKDLSYAAVGSWQYTLPVWNVGEGVSAEVKEEYASVYQTANTDFSDYSGCMYQYIPSKQNTNYVVKFSAKGSDSQKLTAAIKTTGGTYELKNSDGEYPELSSDWQSFEVYYQSGSELSSAVLMISAEQEGVYCIDDIEILETPVLCAQSLEGSFQPGETVRASFTSFEELSEVYYEILVSDDGINFAITDRGVTNESFIDYIVSDTDIGRYLKIQAVGQTKTGITNMISFTSDRIEAVGIYFTSQFMTDTITGEARVFDSSLSGEKLFFCAALYDEQDSLLTCKTSIKNYDSLINNKMEISIDRNYHAKYAKLFLWKLNSLCPLAVSDILETPYKNSEFYINIDAGGLGWATYADDDETVSEDVLQERIDDYVGLFTDNNRAGTILWTLNIARSFADSDTFDSIYYNVDTDENGNPVIDENGNVVKYENPAKEALSYSVFNEVFRTFIGRDIDVFEMAIEKTRKHCVTPWIAIRMNDHHNQSDLYYQSTFRATHPECTVYEGNLSYMNYAEPAVRNYYKNYIFEMCEKYDIEGIELDWLRSTPVLKSVTPENIEIINEYMSELRAGIDEIGKKKGKKIEISARVYPTIEESMAVGLDAASWIADGSIDVLTLSNYYIPAAVDFDIDGWRSAIDEKNTAGNSYRILAGTDQFGSCDQTSHESYKLTLTPEHQKAFASTAYNKGADGIYMFNQQEKASLEVAIDEEGNASTLNRKKDMYKYLDSLEAAENGLRRYIAVYNNTSLRSRAVYPMEVSASNAAQTEIYTGTKPEEGYYLIAVGISDEEGYDENLLNVTINGHATEKIGDMPVSEDYKYTVSSATQPGALNTSQVAPRVMQFKAKLSDITDGYNLINITNSSDKTQYVKWLEIFVDNTKGAEPLEQK